jgi:predicted glycosyltransferase
LLARDWGLWRLAREHPPDVLLTRSPGATHAGRLLSKPSIFDTDNGRSAGLHYRMAAPFASIITTPDCFPADLGPKQIRYPSYKPLAFLHPSRFQPDAGVLDRLGVGSDRYFVIRLVAMQASHDYRETGLPMPLLRQVVEKLDQHGHVFISAEAGLLPEFESFRLPTRPDDFHHVLAGASLCLGDSGSVVQEAAVLGVPAIFVSTFAGRTAPIEELETRYQLVSSFRPTEDARVLSAVDEVLGTSRDEIEHRYRLLLSQKVDLTAWYVDLIQAVARDPDDISSICQAYR